MKITMYELLELIKDGKAPVKIKYEYLIYELTTERDNYYCKNCMRWFTNEINSLEVLNNEVEIIEEPKKIEKLPYYSLEKIQKSKNKDEQYENRLKLLEKRINDYHNKTNELIDEINNLKEKKEEQED